MRTAIVSCFAIVLSLAHFVTVCAAETDRMFRLSHTIEIETQYMDAALEAVQGLSGHNLNSEVFLSATWWGESVRHANIVRRVNSWEFRHSQEVLRGLGEVLYESENARYIGSDISALEIGIGVISEEFERLSRMMAESPTLDILIAIDNRLSMVARDRDDMTGRRNMLLAEAAGPIINIHLREMPGEPPPPEVVSFGARVSDSFMNTWQTTTNLAGNMLVLLARIALPGGIIIAIWAVAGYSVFYVNRRRRSQNAEK